MTIHYHKHDIPAGIEWGNAIAIDTETMGLNNHRDRLCVVQISAGDGEAHLVHFAPDQYDAPNLKALLSDGEIDKLFHFARFDVAVIKKYLGVDCERVYCTKIASRLARTFTERHSLRDLCRELLKVELSKQQQSSDWGADELTPEQQKYAANDVLYLHEIRSNLDEMLAREGRTSLARRCMDFVLTRAELDLAGWIDLDIFAH